jgi:hypothetical protein
MNETLKEIAVKAQVEHCISHVRLEEFAELIVQDIINVLESKNEIRHIASTTFTLSVVEGTIEKSINAITEHFGMKQHYRIKNERTVGRKVSSL